MRMPWRATGCGPAGAAATTWVGHRGGCLDPYPQERFEANPLGPAEEFGEPQGGHKDQRTDEGERESGHPGHHEHSNPDRDTEANRQVEHQEDDVPPPRTPPGPGR